MAEFNLAAIDNLLKEVYWRQIIKAMQTEFPLLNRFQKWPRERIGGKRLNIPVYLKMGDSVMAYSEGGNLAPIAGTPQVVMAQVTVRYLSGVFKLTGQALEASGKSEWALKSALDFAKQDLQDQLVRRQVLDFLGTSSGVRAKVQADASASNTIQVHQGLSWPVAAAGYVFKRGDHIVIEHAGGTVETVVQSVSYDSLDGSAYDRLTVSPAVTVSTGDPIYFGTASQYEKGISPLGLGDLFSDDNYMGIDTNTYPEWQPYGNDPDSPVTFSRSEMTKFLIQTKNWAGGRPNIVLMNDLMLQEFEDMFKGEVRRTDTTRVKAGMQSVQWQVGDLVVDVYFSRMVPLGVAIALDEQYMYWGIQKEGGFLPKGGDRVLYRLDEKDEYRADWVKYYTMFTTKRNAHGVLFYTLA